MFQTKETKYDSLVTKMSDKINVLVTFTVVTLYVYYRIVMIFLILLIKSLWNLSRDPKGP